MTDPTKQTNLFDDPAASKIRAELETYLAEQPDDIGPNGVQVGMA